MKDMGTKEDLLNLFSRFQPPSAPAYRERLKNWTEAKEASQPTQGGSNFSVRGSVKPPAQEIEELIRVLNTEEEITRELTKKNL